MSEEKVTTIEETTVVADNVPAGLDRLGAVVCHTGAFIGLNIIIPLIFVCVVDKEKKDFLYQHAKQALAFQFATFLFLMVMIIGGGIMTAGTGIMGAATAASLEALLLLFAIVVFTLAVLVLICVACYKAATGRPYKYPFFGNL